MDTHRCPQCNALVIDRRFPFCTTCHAALPEEWVMTPEQVAKVSMIDAHARAEHATAMSQLEPANSSDTNATIP